MAHPEVVNTSLTKRVFKVGMVLMAITLVFSGIVVLLPEEAEAIGNPRVTVSLDQSEQSAQVAPGQDGIVTFTGLVRCTMPVDTNIQQVLVSLTGDAGGWAWSITPSSLSFDRSTSELAFSCTVRVPPRTSHTHTGQLTVGGTYRVNPGIYGTSIPGPATAMITIEQYYKFALECAKPFVEVVPGDQMVFTLKLRNEGNDQDTMKVDIEADNFKSLVDKGWAIQLSANNFIINEGEEAIVKITVNTPVEWHILWYNHVTTIRVKIFSEQAALLGEMVMDTIYPLYIRERGVSAPGFEPLILIFAVIFIVMALSIFIPVNRLRKRY